MIAEARDVQWWVPHPDYVWVPGKVRGQAPGDQIVFVTAYGDNVMVPNATVDKLEQCSPTSLGLPVSNLLALEEFGEGAIVHQLRERYKINEIYTFTGAMLLSVNPYKQLPIYSSATSQLYSKQFQTLPPHVFSIVAAAYTRLQREHFNQAIVISGESGSGKTEATKAVLQFLSDVAGSISGAEALMLRSNPVLEAFGNAKTARNDNSSRFGKWMQVEFDGPCISSCSLTSYLLEKSRVVKQANGERNYHVFYQMCAGLPPLMKQKLGLGPAKNYAYLNGVTSTSNDAHDFAELETAFKLLNVGEETTIWTLLTAILMAGNVEFVEPVNQQEGSAVKDRLQLTTLAKLLRVEDANLQSALCFRSVVVKHSVSFVPQSVAQALQTRDALSKALYSRLFDWLVSRVNLALSGPKQGLKYVGILDIFGFEAVDPSSFEQFCINYANERLQQHFNQFVFKQEQAEYVREQIGVLPIEFVDNIGCLELLEKKQSGIFHLLDQEISVPQGSDISLVTKMHKLYSEDIKNPFYARIRQDANMFVVKHYAGNVRYDANGFLFKNRDHLPEALESLMRTSKLKLVESFFRREIDDHYSKALQQMRARKLTNQSFSFSPGSVPSTAAGTDEDKRSRYGSPRADANGKPVLKTLIAQFQERLYALMETIQACEPHFIRCIKPNAYKRPDLFQTGSVLQQMRCAGLFEAIRITQSGYPIRVTMPEFNRKYILCCSSRDQAVINDAFSTLTKTKLLLTALGKIVDVKEIKIGLTKVFMRDRPKAVLDALRNAAVEKVVILVQSVARKYIAKQKVKQIKELCEKCQIAVADRNRTELLIILEKGAQVQTAIFRQASRLSKFLEEEARLLPILRLAATGDAFDRCEAAVSAVQAIDKAFPEEKENHLAEFEHWYEQVQNQKARLLELQQARNQVRDALETEDIPRLQSAIAAAQRLNLPQSDFQEAITLLNQLELRELMIINLDQALVTEQVEISTLEFLLERAQTARSSQAQRNVITRGKARLAERLRQEAQLAASRKEESQLGDVLIPKVTRLGYSEVLNEMQGLLESIWMSRIQEAVEAGDSSKIETEFIPLLEKRGLQRALEQAKHGYEALQAKANEEARAAIAREIEAAKQKAVEEAKMHELKKFWGWKILVAVNQKDYIQLEESIIPSMKALQLDYSDAEMALKTVLNELIMVAVDAKNVELIERIFQKLKAASFDTRLALTGLRLVYGLLLEDAVSALRIDQIQEIVAKLVQYGFDIEPALRGLEKVKDLLRARGEDPDRTDSSTTELPNQFLDKLRILEEKHAASAARLSRMRDQSESHVRSRTPERRTSGMAGPRRGHRRSLSNDAELRSKQSVIAEHRRLNSGHADGSTSPHSNRGSNAAPSDQARSVSPVLARDSIHTRRSLSRDLIREAQETGHGRVSSRNEGIRFEPGKREMERVSAERGAGLVGLFKRGPNAASILAETTIINLDAQLQMAIDRRDLTALTELLQTSQESTHTVRIATKLKARLEDEARLIRQIEAAIRDLELETLDGLLQQATALGLPRSQLLSEASHLCYGQTRQQQLSAQIALAVARVDLPRLRGLLLEADPTMNTEDIANAHHFLIARSRLNSRAVVEPLRQSINKEAAEAYRTFLALKGQKPLSQFQLLRKPGDYSKGYFFKKKEVILVQRFQWRVEDIPRSLMKFSKASCGSSDKATRLKLLAKHLFKNIRCFMGDLFHPYPVTLGFDVLKVGKQEILLRDEIFCQLIKQTTLNAEKSSLIAGLKLMYLCLSTFAPSSQLAPFLWAHLAIWAIPLEEIDGTTECGFETPEELASNCFHVYYLNTKISGWLQGECGPLPSIPDIQLLVESRLAPTAGLLREPRTQAPASHRRMGTRESVRSDARRSQLGAPQFVDNGVSTPVPLPPLSDGSGSGRKSPANFAPPPPPPPHDANWGPQTTSLPSNFVPPPPPPSFVPPPPDSTRSYTSNSPQKPPPPPAAELARSSRIGVLGFSRS